MLPGVTIYFIRHGETDWNAQARYQGQHDIPLNDRGRGQALRNGEALRSVVKNPEAFHFVASPLQRTVETMAIVRSALGLGMDGVAFDDRLREMSYGHWEGQLAADLPLIDPEGVAARAQDWWNWRPRGGESYEDLTRRVAAWLQTVDRDTVVSSHGGVSRALRGLAAAVDRADVPRLAVPQDRVLVLRDQTMSWL
jgi:probable phosphoglycerate mutase